MFKQWLKHLWDNGNCSRHGLRATEIIRLFRLFFFFFFFFLVLSWNICSNIYNIQSNCNGSNTFVTMESCSRHGLLEALRVNHSAVHVLLTTLLIDISGTIYSSNGSNTFVTIESCSRHGLLKLLRVNHSAVHVLLTTLLIGISGNSCSNIYNIQSTCNGSNSFVTMGSCSRHWFLEPLRSYRSSDFFTYYYVNWHKLEYLFKHLQYTVDLQWLKYLCDY